MDGVAGGDVVFGLLVAIDSVTDDFNSYPLFVGCLLFMGDDFFY